MGAAHRFVHKVDRAALERNVVERKTRRLGLRVRGRRLLAQPVKDVLYVVAAVAMVGQPHLGRIHLDRIHHRRQAQQGLQFTIYIDTGDAELLPLAVSAGNGQVTYGQLKRPGLELDRANGGLAAQFFGSYFLALVLQQRGNRQPAQRPQPANAGGRPGHTPQPTPRSRGRLGLGGIHWRHVFFWGRSVHTPLFHQKERSALFTVR